MSILFIALQCFQCSTMQVKQQKKSNKWVCVVCNEKQSVRKIYARSNQAKDVRKFVQGFNSRRPTSNGSDGSGWIEARGDRRSDGGGGSKRMDWSEYLDGEEKGKEEEGEDNDEVLVTTEMPVENFGCKTMGSGKNLKPKMSKKRIDESRQGGNGSLKCSRTVVQKAPSKWSKYLEEEEEEEEDDEGIGLKLVGDDSGLLAVNESLMDGFIVEEEVHPDFA